MVGTLDIVGLTEGLAQLPMAYLVAGATVLLVVTATVLRVLTNTITFKAPPVMEGIPFIGGLIKFSRVGVARCACHVMRQPTGRQRRTLLQASSQPLLERRHPGCRVPST